MALDETFGAFGTARSLPEKGRPCGSAVAESASKTLKAEFVCREDFDSLEGLQVKLSDYAWWCNHERIRSKLGCMSSVEFREKPLAIPSK